MKIFNSLTRKKEKVKPLEEGRVGIYTCGPTVYDYVTIGNWRTYTLGDLMVRALKHEGLEVSYVMNITDVGHLTGDNEGDADTGEDRMEKGARREGKTAWDVAQRYAADFLDGYRKMNMTEPEVFCKATEHIEEQIKMVQAIEKVGLAYKTSDGIYFDVKKYEAEGNKYGELSTLDQIKEGARVEVNEEKRDPRDFALWKFSPEGEKRDMEWESPWGMGFPGWHIECSAMSTKYLGDQFDVHIGGEDLRSTHHPNEIVQAEVATGKKPFVKYWVHGAFLLVDGGRMGKSVGNAYTLHDVEEKGFTAMDLRYFYLTGHYRKQLNFTWEALGAAVEARKKLVRVVKGVEVGQVGCAEFEEKFDRAVGDDLNMPEALAVVWELVKSDYPDEAKKNSLLKFDEVMGLGLGEVMEAEVPDKVRELADKREGFRSEGKWEESDKVREEIEEMGWEVEDTKEGSKLSQKGE